MAISIQPVDATFSDWPGLLRLIQQAFAYMGQRIDPPSSLHQLTAASIAAKAHEEVLFLAFAGKQLVGCVFGAHQAGGLYVNKLAVDPNRQGRGIGRSLMHAIEDHARQTAIPALELKARIELTENHRTFAAMGFSITGEHAHPGYNRPTFVTMRKGLASG